jgi:hypothetical protein
MESCIEKIRRWMIQDKLLMNDGKTELLVIIGTRQQLCKLQPISISVNNSVISPSPHIKNLGSWLDSNLQSNRMFSSEQHCNIVPQYCNFDRQIALSKLQPTRTNCKLEIHKRFVNKASDWIIRKREANQIV